MDIRDLLLKNVMIMDLKGTTKEAVIDEMVAKYHAEGIVTDADEYRNDILKRESESTTGIGEGIAMPHAKDSAVTRATVLFAKSTKGVDFNALDGQPVHLFFMIAAPEGANNEHLAALAALMKSSIFLEKHKRKKQPRTKLKKKRKKPKKPRTKPLSKLSLKTKSAKNGHLSLPLLPAQLESPIRTWPKQL